MSTARVYSIDALETLHISMAKFDHEAREAMASAELEIQRTQNFVENKLKFWLREIDRCREEVNRCKSELSFRKSTISKDSKAGLTEQELALKKAQNRLKEAEEKADTCRKWIRALPDTIKDYSGPARALSGMLDGEMKRGQELLKKQTEALKDYTALHAPQAPTVPTAPPTGGGPT
jgi:hypothetical protein